MSMTDFGVGVVWFRESVLVYKLLAVCAHKRNVYSLVILQHLHNWPLVFIVHQRHFYNVNIKYVITIKNVIA